MLVHELIDDALRWLGQLILLGCIWFLLDGHPTMVWHKAAYVLCVILTVVFLYGWWHKCRVDDERFPFNVTTVLLVIGLAICTVQLLAVVSIQLSRKHEVQAIVLESEWLVYDDCNEWMVRLPDERVYTFCNPHSRFDATGKQVPIVWRNTWLAYRVDVQ